MKSGKYEGVWSCCSIKVTKYLDLDKNKKMNKHVMEAC
jgi:hypothetical protein